MERTEADLAKLLRIAPPPDLAERLRLPQRRRPAPVAVSIYVAGLLAAGVLGVPFATRPDAAAVVDEVMEHIDSEPQAFVSRPRLSPDDYRALAPAVSLDTGSSTRVVSDAAPGAILDSPACTLCCG